jgi:hypothetical protein
MLAKTIFKGDAVLGMVRTRSWPLPESFPEYAWIRRRSNVVPFQDASRRTCGFSRPTGIWGWNLLPVRGAEKPPLETQIH